MQLKKQRFVDGFTPRTAGQKLPKRSRTHTAEEKPVVVTQPDTPTPTSKQKKPRFNIRKPAFSLKYTTLLALCVIIGIATFTYPAAAEIAILVYGLVAIVRRISSKTTFALALIALACVPIAQAVGHNDLSVTFASYTFLFLVFATVCMARDLSST